MMAETLKVTLVRSKIGTKPKQRGTLRALGLGRIGSTNTLPDRPEIRGMLARVPHLVQRGGDPDEDPRPEARARARKRAKRRVGRGIGGKGGKTAGRGHKGQGARGTVPAGFEGGQTPLHRRTPKAKGFNNPFRVEYHVVNLDTLDGFDAGAEVTPRDAARRGPRGQAGPGQGARPGASSPRPSRSGRTGSPRAATQAIEAAGGTTEVLPASVGRPAPARPRERAHQPLGTLRSPSRQEVVGPDAGLSRLRNMFRVPDLRNKILFTIFIVAVFRVGSHIPVPYVDFRAIKELKEQAREQRRASSGSSTCSPAARSRTSRCSSSGSCRTSRRRSSCSCSAS